MTLVNMNPTYSERQISLAHFSLDIGHFLSNSTPSPSKGPINIKEYIEIITKQKLNNPSKIACRYVYIHTLYLKISETSPTLFE